MAFTRSQCHACQAESLDDGSSFVPGRLCRSASCEKQKEKSQGCRDEDQKNFEHLENLDIVILF